ncbi:hypothetical protein INR49_022515 [Caranx melampygus]|nr:hypothetical protein INR49_022515 [Caranx melampygus]
MLRQTASGSMGSTRRIKEALADGSTRLLTERQIKKHGNHHCCHGRTRHGHGRRGQNGYHGRHQHGSHSRQRSRGPSHMEGEDGDEQTGEPDLTSSSKKKRSYSKCRGEQP